MTHGPGKYDDLASYVREQADADAVVVVVFGGRKGSGFSVQAVADAVVNMPIILRELADSIESDLKRGPGEPRQ